MAYTKITFENPVSGQIREAPIGFSWTVLFFGFFPPLFRGDWKWAVIMFFLAMLTMGISSLVFMFIYNNFYVKDLIGSGYKAKSIESGDMTEASTKIGINIPLLESA